ncbi:hypothetical protein [Sphingomonas sp.]|uniref:hypothetical protein n=1 Tax=Sphingomonas sp. TaxID=28214 RepID=UPI0035C83845
MNGGQTLAGYEPGYSQIAPLADFGASEPVGVEAEAPAEPVWRFALAVVFGVLAIAWVGVAAWLGSGTDLSDPLRLLQFVAALCAVPVLLGIAFLVVARTSGAHASRLAAGSRELREETERLYQTAEALAHSMATSRDTLSEQARALTALGDAAAARLETIGQTLAAGIVETEARTLALGRAADTAADKMAVMLATLPRAQDEIRSLGERLEQIGLGAGEQAAALDTQLAALGERGREAEAIAGTSAQKLAAHITRMDASSEAAAAKLDTVAKAVAEEIDALLGRTADAVDESRKGIAAQGDAMLAMVRANQAALDTSARESAEALAERIEIVELVIERVTTRLEGQRQAGEALVREMEGWIERTEGRFDKLHTEGEQRAGAIAQSLDGLTGSADSLAQAIAGGNGAALTAISTAETLLIALDSAAREMDETLAGAVTRLDGRLEGARARLGTIKPELLALVAASESTSDAVEAVAAAVATQRRDAEVVAERLSNGLAEGRDAAAGLQGVVQQLRDEIEAVSETAASRLVEALLRVRETAATAADQARDTLAQVIPEAAHAIEAEAAVALRRAAGRGLDEQIAKVADVAGTAVGAATRAASQLEAQIARIGETSAALEAKVEAAEAVERESFTRRASALIEALNSAAIDLSRGLTEEIGDAAWAAYLKGDRGVFTRRAVRLLDAEEAGEIVQLYEADAGFRDAVNRYIHDFEAMLRIVLAQRDGSPLSVTLLSSDVGKVYVALAQAIERLR